MGLCRVELGGVVIDFFFQDKRYARIAGSVLIARSVRDGREFSV
jgi:hypothetical protein